MVLLLLLLPVVVLVVAIDEDGSCWRGGRAGWIGVGGGVVVVFVQLFVMVVVLVVYGKEIKVAHRNRTGGTPPASHSLA